MKVARAFVLQRRRPVVILARCRTSHISTPIAVQKQALTHPIEFVCRVRPGFKITDIASAAPWPLRKTKGRKHELRNVAPSKACHSQRSFFKQCSSTSFLQTIPGFARFQIPAFLLIPLRFQVQPFTNLRFLLFGFFLKTSNPSGFILHTATGRTMHSEPANVAGRSAVKGRWGIFPWKLAT